MHAEVIAIGDEITSGQRTDTNSAWLSQRLVELGVPVKFHTTVGDDLEACEEAFRIAIERADVVVSTGGLGPTADDLSRDAISAATSRELVLDKEVLEQIRVRFARRQREMPERNRVQALFPAGSRVIPNPSGTAPGVALEISRADLSVCRLYALPGVPVEMHDMWKATVGAELDAASGKGVIRHRRLKCFGAGESHLEAMLPDLIDRGRDPAVGITVHAATITLRITASGPSEEEAYAAMEPTIQTIRDSLDELVYGEEDDELHDVVARLLAEKSLTVATAECGTCGRITAWFADLPDADRVFRGGRVVAASSAGESTGREAVMQMAVDVRDEFNADYGLAVGPFPAAFGQSDAAGEYFFALATPDGVTPRKSRLGAHPAIEKDLAAKLALNLLRLTLAG